MADVGKVVIAARVKDHVPPVHGRPAGGASALTRCKLSTHQRNLSLDFRSMGITLPPVAIVSGVPGPTTLHQRNRSLDSALQRIPEVDVTPSPECEYPSSSSGEFQCLSINFLVMGFVIGQLVYQPTWILKV